MSVNQISVFLENKPGTLSEMTKVLAEAKIDVRAMSLAETRDFGIVRMIVADVYEAMNSLKEADFICSLTSVLAFEITDEPGGLGKIVDGFTQAGVNIEYMYASLSGKHTGQAYMIFRVADTKAAEAFLVGKGYIPLTQEDIAGI
jgi:hypothetical protein